MSEVLFEKTGHTALITFNKPASLNALNEDFMDKINEALDKAEGSSEIYVLILTGSEKSFIAGADIEEMYAKDKASIFDWSSLGSELNLRLESMSIPVIAAVNGYALGGGLELAMACDIRIASENAKLGLPETSLGVICGAGGTQRLPRIVGEAFAKEMIFTARVLTAAEALHAGLVSKVVPKDSLLDEAFKLAAAIEKNGQLAVRAAKFAVDFARNSSIADGCLYERKAFSALFDTEDQKTGMGGFLKKEKNIEFKNK